MNLLHKDQNVTQKSLKMFYHTFSRTLSLYIITDESFVLSRIQMVEYLLEYYLTPSSQWMRELSHLVEWSLSRACAFIASVVPGALAAHQDTGGDFRSHGYLGPTPKDSDFTGLAWDLHPPAHGSFSKSPSDYDEHADWSQNHCFLQDCRPLPSHTGMISSGRKGRTGDSRYVLNVRTGQQLSSSSAAVVWSSP